MKIKGAICLALGVFIYQEEVHGFGKGLVMDRGSSSD
jgi:hypothetical protein